MLLGLLPPHSLEQIPLPLQLSWAPPAPGLQPGHPRGSPQAAPGQWGGARTMLGETNGGSPINSTAVSPPNLTKTSQLQQYLSKRPLQIPLQQKSLCCQAQPAGQRGAVQRPGPNRPNLILLQPAGLKEKLHALCQPLPDLGGPGGSGSWHPPARSGPFGTALHLRLPPTSRPTNSFASPQRGVGRRQLGHSPPARHYGHRG